MTQSRARAIVREVRRLRELVEDQAMQIAALQRASAPQVRINREILGTLQRAPASFNGHAGATE